MAPANKSTSPRVEKERAPDLTLYSSRTEAIGVVYGPASLEESAVVVRIDQVDKILQAIKPIESGATPDYENHGMNFEMFLLITQLVSRLLQSTLCQSLRVFAAQQLRHAVWSCHHYFDGQSSGNTNQHDANSDWRCPGGFIDSTLGICMLTVALEKEIYTGCTLSFDNRVA